MIQSRLLIFAFFALLIACNNGDLNPNDPEGDADSDSDGETDSDGDSDSDGDIDAESDSDQVTHPPACPSDVECVGDSASCDGDCALTCLGGIPVGIMDCSAFGECVINNTAVGDVALCEGGGWLDPCDVTTYTAGCEGNVAFRCNSSTNDVRLTTCERDELCWAEGPFAGCRPAPDECSNDRQPCDGSELSAPCCEGFYCDITIGACLPNDGSCTDQFDCPRGQVCRDRDAPNQRPTGEGQCVTPTCILVGENDISEGERCSFMQELPCCGEPSMSCEEAMSGGTQCCFPSGVEPLREGSIAPTFCCSDTTGTDDICD